MADEAPGSPGATPLAPAPRRPTVHQQLSFVCFATAAVAAVTFVEAGAAPEAVSEGSLTPFSCAASLFAGFAHSIWISLDRRRQGLEPGWWRLAAFFLGPLVIWLHLIVRYRLKAIWMIPVSILPYLAVVLASMMAYELAVGFLEGP